MKSQYQAEIHRFIQHFETTTNEIAALRDASGVLKKTLYVALLDAVSKSVHSRGSNRDRFVSLIRKFSQWRDRERVSLPHLAQLLNLTSDPAFEPLRQMVQKRFELWLAPWGPIYLSEDPEPEEIEELWPKERNHRMTIEGISPDLLMHCQFLYAYRNFLVHELREPGYDMEFGEEKEPHYQDVTTVPSVNGPAVESFEPVYPLPFFESLATAVLPAVSDYLLQTNINPYEAYGFGTYWIGVLL